MNAPPGSNSPVSSKVTTPLQSRLQPCSGWLTTVCAASRSGADAAGQGGVCGHISAPVAVHRACFRLAVVCAAYAALRRFQSILVAALRKWPSRARPITRADHMASGINSTFRQVGIATGIAMLGTLFSSNVKDQVLAQVAAVPGLSRSGPEIATAVQSGEIRNVI